MKEKLYLKKIIESYEKDYEYSILKKALTIDKNDLISEIKKAGLLGRGGAGFPTWKKLDYVKDKDEVYYIANADEGEPGTFKDRYILENNPSLLLEGLMILSYIVNSKQVFIYIRGEYIKAINKIQEELINLKKVLNTLDLDINIRLVKGAGAYVCGDETSLINSIEGRRPNSRIKPPYPTDKGLFGKSTVINNIETISNIPLIIRDGGDEYSKLGTDKSKGTKLICLSGKIKNPGVYEIEFGAVTFRDLIYEFGNGILNNERFKFLIPGGVSTKILTIEDLNTKISYEDLQEAGSSLGSGAVIVASESIDVLDVCRTVSDFFMNETCGICFPCKEGSRQINHLLNKIEAGEGQKEYFELIKEISTTTKNAARCGLGQSSGNFICSVIDKFIVDFTKKVEVNQND